MLLESESLHQHVQKYLSRSQFSVLVTLGCVVGTPLTAPLHQKPSRRRQPGVAQAPSAWSRVSGPSCLHVKPACFGSVPLLSLASLSPGLPRGPGPVGLAACCFSARGLSSLPVLRFPLVTVLLAQPRGSLTSCPQTVPTRLFWPVLVYSFIIYRLC